MPSQGREYERHWVPEEQIKTDKSAWRP
jgi:hypothetical protein